MSTRRPTPSAEELGVEHAPLAELEARIAEVDAVFAAAHVDRPLIQAGMLSARHDRPLTLIDLSLPRAIDAACAGHPGVRLHNLADLEHVVAANRARRETEIPAVEALLQHEMEHLVRWAERTLAGPRVGFLPRSFEIEGELGAR